uniref:Putative secreted peptide n=1 Tax=Anopheles braziliensis TaxID=58242 RepID=A0A2M3ZWB6_9DIPT
MTLCLACVGSWSQSRSRPAVLCPFITHRALARAPIAPIVTERRSIVANPLGTMVWPRCGGVLPWQKNATIAFRNRTEDMALGLGLFGRL